MTKSYLTRSVFSQPQCPSGARVCNTYESGLKGRCLTSGVVYKIYCVKISCDVYKISCVICGDRGIV